MIAARRAHARCGAAGSRSSLRRGCAHSVVGRGQAGGRKPARCRSSAPITAVDWQLAARASAGRSRVSRLPCRRRQRATRRRATARSSRVDAGDRPRRSGGSTPASTLSAGVGAARRYGRRRHRQGRGARLRRRRQAAVAGARSRAKSPGRRRSAEGIVVVWSGDGRIFGLRRRPTASQKWVYQRAKPPLTVRNVAGGTLTRGGLFAGTAGGKLLALDLAHRQRSAGRRRRARRRARPSSSASPTSRACRCVDEQQVCAVAFQGRVACFEIAARHARSGRATCRASTGIAADDALPLRHRRQGRGARARQGDRRVGLEAGQARRAQARRRRQRRRRLRRRRRRRGLPAPARPRRRRARRPRRHRRQRRAAQPGQRRRCDASGRRTAASCSASAQ